MLSVDSSNPPKLARTVQASKSTFALSTLPGRVEVAVHTAHEKYPSSLRDENVHYPRGDRLIRLQCDEGEMSYDRADDVESGM